MKILDIIKEMNNQDVGYIDRYLHGVFQKYKLNFVLTNHAVFDRLINDKSRQNITKDDIDYTLETFLKKSSDPAGGYAKKIEMYKRSHKEIEGLITNLNNNLRIIFSIDFHRPPTLDINSGVARYNFKLITALVSDDFKSDNFAHTEKFFVR